MKRKFLNYCSALLMLVSVLGLIMFVSSCSNDVEDEQSLELMSLQETLLKNSNMPMSNAPGNDPIAVIAINGGFSELVEALSYVDSELDAGLVDLFLNGKDQYTVFAPTNTAFNKLYIALGVSDITDLDPELVLAVLKYHVTTGRRAANSVVPRNGVRNIETLLGITFSVTPQAKINAVGNMANIIVPNISASNGIIHVIDEVLLPIGG